jgi:anhydro-N-acetylmuramic acid kinase
MFHRRKSAQVCGFFQGGADLREELPGWNVDTSQAIGIDPDFKEALLIAVLAVARVHNIPGNMPRVTGARELAVLGQITSG